MPALELGELDTEEGPGTQRSQFSAPEHNVLKAWRIFTFTVCAHREHLKRSRGYLANLVSLQAEGSESG